MKKAAKRKIFRSPKLKPKSSLLLVAILVLAVVGFVVWAVIAKSPGKTPHAAVAQCSASSYPGTTVTQGSQLVVRASGFGPGPLPIRMVGVYGTPTRDLAILNSDPFAGYSAPLDPNQQLGSYRVYVDAGGFGKVYCTPDPINVVAAPTCVFSPSAVAQGEYLGIITNNFTAATLAVHLEQVIPNTPYRLDLGTISRTGGSVIIPTLGSGIVANNASSVFVENVKCANSSSNDLLNLKLTNPGCSIPSSVVAGGQMSVGSVSGLVGAIQMIRTDASATAVSMNIGTLSAPYTNVAVPPTPAGTYYIRVGAYGVTCKVASGVIDSTQLNVAAYIPTCKDADVDHNGRVLGPDVLKVQAAIGQSYPNSNYNPVYDLDKNGKVNLADLSKVVMFFGQNC